MADSTLWWLLTAAAVGVELVSGTFYLLMLALGLASAALAAHLGLGASAQWAMAALVGSAAVSAWRIYRSRSPCEPQASANRNVNLDIGETVQVQDWNADATADVHYRGARWSAVLRPGAPPQAGAHRVVELVGNRLVIEKI